MTKSSLILMICAGSISMTAQAESIAAVGGPVTGFVFDTQADRIRPMLGFPGSSYLGAAVVTGVDSASISPDGSSAFATQAGKLVLYTQLASSAPRALSLTGAIAADHFAWVPGAAAAIYSSKSGQAQIITNLLETPSVGAPIDLSTLSGQISAIAFDGQQIILAVTSGASDGIYTVSAQSGPQRIASATSPAALALAGADLYFADQQTGQIWQVQGYAKQPVPAVFANDASTSSPVGLQLSTDGRRLYVANAGSHTVAIYDIASRSQTESIPLSFPPTKLDRFGSNSVFLLNATGQATPLCVFTDANAAKPATYFVPAPDGSGRHPIRYRPN
jgi:DNA-binding beta-propeller fold protein YncE